MHRAPCQLFTPAEAEHARQALKRAAAWMRELGDVLRRMTLRALRAVRALRALGQPAADPRGATRYERPAWQSPYGPPRPHRR
ncbi:hypothetical protein ACFY3M_13860 [Streptomyces mirabilis]|uniref:hypothetical protein n=1 Tax=Streptomyces mirabilis TaxID=68239 RepID=UPI003685D17F